jgi:hypothetical protein
MRLPPFAPALAYEFSAALADGDIDRAQQIWQSCTPRAGWELVHTFGTWVAEAWEANPGMRESMQRMVHTLGQN